MTRAFPSDLPPGLYLVATPIGNLKDITLRALEVLAGADIIAAEDTRTTGKLLRHHGIEAKKLIACHDHNEQAMAAKLVKEIAGGRRVALVSDAGTPLISDPGYRLVKACREAGVYVSAIPGPSSVLTALSMSGLPPLPFTFHGFLEAKAAARQKQLASISAQPGTHIFFEAANRLKATLEELHTQFPDAAAAVGRELTKLHEEMVNGTPLELFRYYESHPLKGEVVLMIRIEKKSAGNWEDILRQRLDSLSLKEAVDEVSALTGVSRRTVYQKALELKS